MSAAISVVDTPIDPVTLVAEGGHLIGVYLSDHSDEGPPAADQRGDRGDRRVLGEAAEQLAEYFDGDRRTFDLPLDLMGTDFQRSVWHALRTVPFGRTASYGQIAEAVGRPAAVRAVGLANGRNPVSIVVPCHRVIGADGRLTGYGGGLGRKRWLLDHERSVVGATLGL